LMNFTDRRSSSNLESNSWEIETDWVRRQSMEQWKGMINQCWLHCWSNIRFDQNLENEHEEIKDRSISALIPCYKLWAYQKWKNERENERIAFLYSL